MAESVKTITVAGSPIKLQSSIKSLGVYLDSHMSFDKHVFEICKASYFHIRALRHIRSSLTTEAAKTVAMAIVNSRLDYCNCMHIRIKSCLLSVGSEHPCSSCCTKVSILPHHASFGRPSLAPCTPSNQFQNCHNCFQGTLQPHYNTVVYSTNSVITRSRLGSHCLYFLCIRASL